VIRGVFEGFLGEVCEARGAAQLGRAFCGVAGRFGYDRCAVLDAAQFGGDIRAAIVFTTELKGDLAKFANANGYARHPIFLHAASQDAPFLAGDFGKRQSISYAQWLATLPPEIREGEALFLPVHRGDGLVLLCGCAGSAPDVSPLSTATLHAAAHVLYDRLIELRSQPTQEAVLTGREAECVRWFGLGKADHEIAEIVGISARTVRYHLRNAKTKLGAATRIEALSKLAGGARGAA
jgi:DNA-binding CsgD family transcriptional regulator